MDHHLNITGHAYSLQGQNHNFSLCTLFLNHSLRKYCYSPPLYDSIFDCFRVGTAKCLFQLQAMIFKYFFKLVSLVLPLSLLI